MSNRAQAITDVAEVFKFEQWLRFYFAMEAEAPEPSGAGNAEEQAVRLMIPDHYMDEIKADYPNLADLAELVNGTAITYESSCATVCGFVSSRLDGAMFPHGLVDSVLNGREFQVEVHLFNLWIDGHEEYLDEQYRPFSEWQSMYEEWKAADKVQEYRQSLLNAQSATANQSTH